MDKSLKELSFAPSFANAQKAIGEVISLLGFSGENDWKLFTDSNGKIRSNATWFMMADGFADKRATYKIAEEGSNHIDFKAYWVKNLSKSVISWIVALTPNFEDEPFYKSKSIGIDFIIPEKAGRIIVVLSDNYVIRTLELYEGLSLTQQEIFDKWMQPLNFENKEQVHGILWQSFDLEAVNKTFYKGISSFFVELRQHLSDKKIFSEKHAAFFTNRLIGRVVFCWFLDKKGIINSEMKYFETGDQKSTDYYHTKLETLFFKVLNTPVDDRDVINRIEQKSLIPGTISPNLFNANLDLKTPFLNGGLFEPREHDKFGEADLKFPEDFFDRFFTFLRHYNFTTDESTSSFQQVAIDPEMLGRIFENLLAEQTEETGEQARKAKGAFYTPREIVDYMCRESLREYLKTKIPETDDSDQRISQLLDSKPHEWRDQQRNYRDDLKPYKKEIISALDELKIIDPACGSGAFPMGMMQLLLQCYERLEPRFDSYTTKLDVIKNNIHGVDIEPMAVEISRLRAWLSIIVDEDADSKKIQPLPNLDFKFVCANSLIPLKKEAGGLFDTIKGDDLIEIRDRYFNARSKNSKENLRSKYEKLIGRGDTGSMLSSDYEIQLKSYHPFDSENVTQFFDPEFMFGVDGFDIVIGNPPYVQLQKLKGDPIQEVYKKVGYEVYDANGDLYCLFYERGLQLSKLENGLLCFITSNKWMRAGYGEKLRKYLSSKKPLTLVDLGPGVFASATVDTNILLIKNKGTKNESDYSLRAMTLSKRDAGNISEAVRNNGVDLPNPKQSAWFVGSLDELALKTKIEKLGKPLKDWNIKIYRGILTGLNEAFIIDQKKRDDLIAKDSRSAEIINPILRGRDIKRYGYEWAGLYIIGTFPVLKINIDTYPAVKEYFVNFGQERLEQVGRELSDGTRSRKKTGNKWFETQDQIAYYTEFEKEKVVWKRIGSSLRFGLDTDGMYCQDSTCVMTGDNLKYICAFMNSKLGNKLLFDRAPKTGTGDLIVSVQALEPLLIPPITEQNKQSVERIEDIVNQILQARKTNSKANIIDLEKEIDQLVYKLYDLTEEEVGIIEKE